MYPKNSNPKLYKIKVLLLFVHLSFYPSGRLLVVHDLQTQGIFIYDIKKDEIVKIIHPDGIGVLSAIDFIDEQNIIVAGSDEIIDTSPHSQIFANNNIQVWNIDEGKRIGNFNNAHEGTITGLESLGEEDSSLHH